jgi:ubiquinone/menaquinone biosynthesis C-methylase UbiE
MDNQELKQKIRSAFDQAAAGYDKPALRFFSETGECLADHMGLLGHEHILDVASGTGAAALACARRLGKGRVTGIDLSEAMLDQARAKAARNRLENVQFQPMDIEVLSFPPDAFDGACCSFGVFFLPDMAAGLRNIASVVKPGGRIGITSFTEQVFEPLVSIFFDHIQRCGLALPPLSWKRLDHPDKHRQLYESAGLRGIETHREPMGYHLKDEEDWWDILWNSGFRGLLNQLSAMELAAFRRQHLQEIAAHATGQGIWLEMEALITVGHKPER